jgi:GT2 family glycosyltransferase
MEKFINSLSIIIVVYNQKIDECASFRSIISMKVSNFNLDIFIYDNSTLPQTMVENKSFTIKYYHDSKNSGVSKAYNQGAMHAMAKNKSWVLLLDQDTLLPANLLQEYEKVISTNSELMLFVPILKLKNGIIFSPCRYRFKRGFFVKEINPGIHNLKSLSPVNSGMLINLNAFNTVGGYNNNVKLDFADFQFIERFKKKYPKFYILDTYCIQDFSNDNVTYKSQVIRFQFYCEGARNIEKNSLIDWFSYGTFTLFRALKLCIKYKKIIFLNIYFNSFIKTKS